MFEDFAQARNEVLRSTTHHFPDASHVLFADADWRLDLATVDLSEVDHIHASFQFLVWDHSGDTTRYMGWLLRNDRRLRFKYRCDMYFLHKMDTQLTQHTTYGAEMCN